MVQSEQHLVDGRAREAQDDEIDRERLLLAEAPNRFPF